jgi:hypothetical protein
VHWPARSPRRSASRTTAPRDTAERAHRFLQPRRDDGDIREADLVIHPAPPGIARDLRQDDVDDVLHRNPLKAHAATMARRVSSAIRHERIAKQFQPRLIRGARAFFRQENGNRPRREARNLGVGHTGNPGGVYFRSAVMSVHRDDCTPKRFGLRRLARHRVQCVSVSFSAIRRELSKKIDTRNRCGNSCSCKEIWGNPFYFKGFANGTSRACQGGDHPRV